MKKKIITTIIGSLIYLGTINAQVIQSYGFESAIGAYSEITGGTVVWQGADTEESTLTSLVFYSPTSKSKEKVTDVSGFPIGFDFAYDNQLMNCFAISSHGAIILGRNKVTVDPAPASLLATNAAVSSWEEGRVDVLGNIMTGTPGHVYGTANTEISYKTEGTEPERVLVVQFKNYEVPLDNAATIRDEVNLQIRLYENSNKIEFVYNDWNHSGSTNRLFRVGLKGSFPRNVHLRTSANQTWNNTAKSLDANINWSSTIAIPDGLTFTFTSPGNCVTPADQPTDLLLNPSTEGISGSFTASASADHYLTLISKESALTVTPQDNQYYSAGDVLGNGTVISYDTIKTFATLDTLLPATTYYIHVFAVNSYCDFGPKYKTNPLTASATTLPAAPAAFSVVDAEYDKITLSVTANSANQKVLIATVDSAATWSTSIYQYGNFGTPSGNLNVGDSIDGGGLVVYKGDASNNLVFENLENNKIYHYAAWTWDGEEKYSSTFHTADTLTWGKVPLDYENFKAYPNFVAPFGWETYGDKKFQINRYQVLECLLSAANATGSKNGIITPWILLKEEANRAFIDIQAQEYVGRTWSAYNVWDERDTLQISVSEDGENFIPIHTICLANNNVPTFTTATATNTSTFPKLNIPFTTLSGKKVKLKVEWLTYKNARMYIANIKIVEKPLCDFPFSLTVDNSSIISDKALIDWTPDGDATIWEVHYRVEGSENWSTPIETDTHPYLVTGLPYQSKIELQVRSKCSLTSLSPWSETLSFVSGYNLPFNESFDANVLPAGWKLEKGIISDSTEFCTGMIACQKNWGVNDNTLNINYTNAAYQWAILPLLDFGDGSVNYTFDFDLTVTGETEIPDTDSLIVVVSKDGGKTFSIENILEKYDILSETTAAIDGKVHHSIALSGYIGIQQFAFYAVGNGDERIILDNIGILESCPAATNAEVLNVEGDGAKITWEGTADEWLVFVRQAGETTKNYQGQTASELVLTGLTAATSYEVGITHSCSEGDTARIVIVAFTTLATIPCDEVENIQVELTQTSATIVWTAEAASYNIKFRPTDNLSEIEWFVRTTQTNSITLSGLEPDTEYEYMIQAVCSQAEGDVSDWTEAAVFNTLPITCFPPTAIAIVPAHRSAVITWESEADDYEIAYRTSDELWITSIVQDSKTNTITGLIPETTYSLRIRSICAENDTSTWATESFTTTAIPSCIAPFNLQATGITATSVTLTWEADAANLTWDVRYRLGVGTDYTTVTGLTETTYPLANLTPATAYVWNVKATCEENASGWISGNFTTDTDVRLNSISKNAWNVFVSGKAINILNPERTIINRIRLYDLNGLIIKDYDVNTNENVLIPEATRLPAVIVKVEGQNTSATFKVLIK
jgi:hypothetical protein